MHHISYQCSRTYAGALGTMMLLASSAHEAHADPPAAPADLPGAPLVRPTFRLEYQRLDAQSARTCPNELSARKLADHVFGYAVVDDDAKFAISLDVAVSHQPSRYEVVSHILDGDQISRMTRIYSVTGSEPDHCLKAVYRALMVLADLGDHGLEEIQALPALELALTIKAPPPVEREKEPVKPTPLLPTPSISVTLPPPAPASAWSRPQGFMLAAGLTTTVGLTPTPSLGGLVGVSYRRGDWSGGLEGRVEHGLVPAYLQRISVESLYAGAAIVAPCVHEGVFSGCFILEGGGYSFNPAARLADMGGRFVSLASGFRANLEHRVGEHFLMRGFVQVSGLPIGPYLKLDIPMSHAWDSGPGFGTVGITIVTLP